MVRPSGKPVYIRPDTARIGDTVRVTWKSGDVTLSRVGTVAKRGTYGNRTEALTAGGYTLFAWAGATREPEACTITLLSRTDTESEYLF